MYDTTSGSVPPNIAKLVTRSRNIHSYNTRFSNAGNFHVNKSRLNQQLLSFARSKTLECLSWKFALPRRFLNKEIHALLLNLLNSEDTYRSSSPHNCHNSLSSLNLNSALDSEYIFNNTWSGASIDSNYCLPIFPRAPLRSRLIYFQVNLSSKLTWNIL